MHSIVKEHLLRLTQNSGLPSNFPIEDVRKKLILEPPAISEKYLEKNTKFTSKDNEEKAKIQVGLVMSNISK